MDCNANLSFSLCIYLLNIFEYFWNHKSHQSKIEIVTNRFASLPYYWMSHQWLETILLLNLKYFSAISVSRKVFLGETVAKLAAKNHITRVHEYVCGVHVFGELHRFLRNRYVRHVHVEWVHVGHNKTPRKTDGHDSPGKCRNAADFALTFALARFCSELWNFHQYCHHHLLPSLGKNTIRTLSFNNLKLQLIFNVYIQHLFNHRHQLAKKTC